MNRNRYWIALLFVCMGCSSIRIIPEEKTVSKEIAVQATIDLSSFSAIPNKNIPWGVGATMDQNGQPRDASEANAKYGKYGATFVGPLKQEVYLTFDNGYENGNTPKILDVLKEKNVKAIFFLTGDYVKKNKDLVRRMIAEGHEIGNHGLLHKSFPTLNPQGVYDEIQKLDQMVRDEFQYQMKWMRPPMGEFSERALAIAQKLGYHTLLWSYAYYDYDVNKQPSQQAALDKLMKGAHPGAIYLLHSISDTNMKILGQLIDQLRAKGYAVQQFEHKGNQCDQLQSPQAQCQ